MQPYFTCHAKVQEQVLAGSAELQPQVLAVPVSVHQPAALQRLHYGGGRLALCTQSIDLEQ
jgi:hypothetical protein